MTAAAATSKSIAKITGQTLSNNDLFGAISGAMMAIGILEGQTNFDLQQHKSKTYELSTELHTKFKDEFGSIICDELTGIDMSDSQKMQDAIDTGHFGKICPKFIESTIRAVLTMYPDKE